MNYQVDGIGFMSSNKREYTIIDLDRRKNKKIVCLTLDLEQDYGDLLNEPSYEGLQYTTDLADFFNDREVPLTCFVQGSLLETHPVEIKRLFVMDIEFELHSYSHPGPEEMNVESEVERGKEAYKRFFGKEPIGYRAPLGIINGNDYEILAAKGFKFDSSVFPSLRPGAFNNLHKPTKPYFVNKHKIVEFPLTVVSNIIRVPVSLSYIKLLGKAYLYLLKSFNLPNLIVFGFHLHDLFQLDSSNNIPLEKMSSVYRKIFKKIYLEENTNGLYILNELIMMLKKKGYMFSKLTDIYHLIPKEQLLEEGL